MYIGDIWLTQHNLKRIDQIPGMILEIEELPPIKINEVSDGEREFQDGHHRAHALWCAGVRELERHQYELYYTEYPKRRYWRLEDSPHLKQMPL